MTLFFFFYTVPRSSNAQRFPLVPCLLFQSLAHHSPTHSWDFSPSKGHARNEVVTFCREQLLSVLFSSRMRESITRSGVQQDRRAKWVSDDRKWNCALFVGSTVKSISSNSLFFPPRREQGHSANVSLNDAATLEWVILQSDCSQKDNGEYETLKTWNIFLRNSNLAST